MEDSFNFDDFQDFLDKIKGRYRILQDQIDLNLQKEYFKYAKKMKDAGHKEQILERQDELYSDNVMDYRKKELLCLLAGLNDVKAYRIIEKFYNDSNGELRNWSSIALQESRMIIESGLLDEKKVLISTGLGGKENLLRYFIVFFASDRSELTDHQKMVIKNELDFSLKKFDFQIEEINFSGEFAKVVLLLPLDTPLKQVFNNFIHEANSFGNFLHPQFLITNVKKFTNEEISTYYEKKLK